MILLGCLLVIGFSIAPRVMLVLAALFSERWPIVWGDNWLAPLLGIVFLPYTTIMYLLVWAPNGIQGWDWIWIVLGLILDAMHWAQYIEKRRQVPGYSTATAAVTGSSSGSASTMTSPSYAPAAATPAAPPAAAAAPAAPSGSTAEVAEPEDVTPKEPPPSGSSGA
jgi:hypothetical protein